MSKIKVLPVHLVNKIAAGECIERPASIVKELVENSLDAGATRIDITLEQGGCKLIRVVDDGCGVDPEDLPLAVTPHATSKLKDENDLYTIETMGFRGEALTSIGSIALLKITSNIPGQTGGATIEVNGGEISQVRPAACAPGTTIEVHNLFFNTPARRKFLKTAQTELGHCQEAVTRLALAYPKIGFSLVHGARQLLELPPAESPRSRISDLFGSQVADDLIQVFNQSKEITFSAYLSRPDRTRPSANCQYFFVNRRTIRDRLLSHALREAYRGLIPQDRQPIGFLFLEIDPSIVDVNVHPTKSEVRFADSGRIHSLVLNSIRERFLSTDLTATLTLPTAKEGSEPADIPERQQVKNAVEDFLKSAYRNNQTHIPFSLPKPSGGSGSGASPYPPRAQPMKSVPVQPDHDYQSTPADSAPPAFQVLQIHNTYLVVETREGMMIVDQHALHERVLYQKLRTKIADGAVARQPLLIPELVNLSSEQMEQIDQIKSCLLRAGIEIEPFGPQTIAIHSLPAIVGQLNGSAFVEELLHRLGKTAAVEAEQVLEHVLQSLACKAAVKAGDPLKPDEIQSLLDAREQIDLSSACPHGRPTTLQMSLADLQKQFKRT